MLAKVLVSLDKGNFDLNRTGPKYELEVRPFQSNWWNIYNLSPDHVIILFKMIAECSVMNMKLLDLYNCNIPHIPAELLSQAVTKLETFRAQGGVLTAAQISAVFTWLSVMEDRKLKTLDLFYNNLSSVPTETLVAGISGLEEVNLAGTKLTSEQLTGIYRMVADRRCSRLKKIYLYQNDHSSVSQDIQDSARLSESVKITASVYL